MKTTNILLTAMLITLIALTYTLHNKMPKDNTLTAARTYLHTHCSKHLLTFYTTPMQNYRAQLSTIDKEYRSGKTIALCTAIIHAYPHLALPPLTKE